MAMRNYGTPAWLEVASKILRRMTMEKYGVKVDPKKVEQEKRAGAGAKKPSPTSPHRNVPMDPEKGTEPFESEPDSGSQKED